MNLFDDSGTQLRVKVYAVYVLLILANIGTWAWAFVALSHRPALLGTAFLAYIFGLRHAFDVDHIAAIDNVVRKLVQDGKRPYSAGFFFSLGHSTVVVVASTVIAATAAAMQTKLQAPPGITAPIGTMVSAVFLLAIGIANLFVLRRVWRAFRRARSGESVVEEDLGTLLKGSGLLARILRPVVNLVSRSWMMYPIGLLFGLGFDTATEISLLGISAAQGAQGVSPWTILVFPALFTVGMSLMDTTDSILMTQIYGWAYINPVRKLWYNLAITTLSVLVALLIGGLEAFAFIKDEFRLERGFWSFIDDLNSSLTTFGYAVVGLFLGIWILSTLSYRMREKIQSETA